MYIYLIDAGEDKRYIVVAQSADMFKSVLPKGAKIYKIGLAIQGLPPGALCNVSMLPGKEFKKFLKGLDA